MAAQAPTDIIESEEILQYLSPALLTVDYDSKIVQATIVSATFVFFAALFVSSFLVCNCFSAFRSLHAKHKAFMSLAVVRGFYGFFCIWLGSYALFWTTNLDRDVVFGRNASSAVAMLFTVGFFIFELGAVLITDIIFQSFSKMLITHHGLALVAYSIAVYTKANYAFGCKALILEMSTPFSCLCFVLLKAGMERSFWWRANQMVLVHTFHLRSVVECYLWYVTYQNWNNIWTNMPVAIFTLLYVNMILVTFVMTPYWGYKKTQQLFNPVDWNFQESRDRPTSVAMANGHFKKGV